MKLPQVKDMLPVAAPARTLRDDVAIASFAAVVAADTTWKNLDEAWAIAYLTADGVIATHVTRSREA